MPSPAHPVDELRAALKASRVSFAFAAVFSLFINLVLLAPALYMLQVYDRVLTSGSQSTLLLLTLLVLGLYLLMGALEVLRSRILVRISSRLDLTMNARLFMASFDAGLRGGRSTGSQPMQDLGALRGFLTGPGLLGFFDAPWIPVYMAVLFILHPLIGMVALVGAALLAVLAVANELVTRKPLGRANQLAVASNQSIEGNLRNAEALEAMGMAQNLHRRWLVRHLEVLRLQSLASDRAGTLTNASKTLRVMLQSLVLGVGAYLAVQHIVTPGVMIAGSILMGRALAPIDMLINSWKTFQSARSAYVRLENLLQLVPARERRMSLPAPLGRLSLEHVVATPPGAQVPVLKRLSLQLAPGESLGVIGPSAAGKSTLARVVLGVWPVASGTVRLDGADIAVWNREELGPYVGYLPQDVELFDGTVKENIVRFGDVNAEQVVDAAQRAGAHDMIHQLPEAYDTYVGVGGTVLSGGQRQRLGLARAIYGRPVLVVLDEPNSNLDEQGEAALTRAIERLRADGATVLLITHRPSVLKTVDKVLVLKDGTVSALGQRDEILKQVTRPRVPEGSAVASLAGRGSA